MSSIIVRLAGLFSGRSELALPRRAFLGAAVAGAALAVVPSLVSSPARADSSDRDHVGDAMSDLRKAREEISKVDHDRDARDYALRQIDQALEATSRIGRG